MKNILLPVTAVLILCVALGSCQKKATWEELAQTANSLYQEGQYQKAVETAQEALEVARGVYQPGSPDLAMPLNDLASLFTSLGQHAEAERIYLELLALDQKHLGDEHLNVARDLNNLGANYRAMGKLEEAEPLFLRSIQICEKILGPDHPNVVKPLLNLAELYEIWEDPSKTASVYERILSIYEANMGPDHPDLAPILEDMADFYRSIDQTEPAEELDRRARAIRANAE
jgi:tetratricopeptide (TPR) repeat protein